MHPVRCVGSGPGIPEGTYRPCPVGCSPTGLAGWKPWERMVVRDPAP